MVIYFNEFLFFLNEIFGIVSILGLIENNGKIIKVHLKHVH